MPRTRKQPEEKDAITLLKADHQKVRALLGELTEATSGRRRNGRSCSPRSSAS
jgi:hypothetical protein